MTDLINKIAQKQILTKEESKILQENILENKFSEEEIIKIFKNLEKRNLEAHELLGIVEATREKMKRIKIDFDAIDTAGTGGDRLGTYNISTAAAIIIASAGIPVVKHGNRSATSKCGSADVLEELGVKIDLDEKKALKVLKKAGIVFLFAPNFHPAFKNVSEARKKYGRATYFNILGPMVNPASPSHQIIGIFDPRYKQAMGKTMIDSGSKKIWVVHNEKNKMDEISPIENTQVMEFTKKNPEGEKLQIIPENLGLNAGKIEDLFGGIKEINAAIMRNVLQGRSNPAQKNAAIINAAAGLVVFGKAKDMQSAVKKVEELVKSGKAFEKLEEFIYISNSV